jgi:exodeoxyribonuclease VII small subunit
MTDQTELPTSPAPEAAADEPTFSEALEALEGILERIEGEEIDLDELAAELREGAQLLDLCRAKIRRAEVEVSQIVQSLDESPSEDDED